MRAVRKDYFLDHDHSAYVDQWDWEKRITPEQRNLDFLTDTVKKIWKVLKGAEQLAQELYPQLKSDKYPNLPDELIHAPWEASPVELAAAGVRLGNDYPAPIVDHDGARRRALDALATLPKRH